MLLGSMSSIQLGSALATFLFDSIGVTGTVFVRVLFSAALLILLWRPSFRLPRRQALLTVLFGLTLTATSLAFYAAIDRIPLGVASTIEFVGPLGVALLASRRRLDLAWATVAAVGVILLTGGIRGEAIDPVGVALALLAGVCWGSYIVVGTRLGGVTSGGGPLGLAMVAGAALTLPFGIVEGGSELLSPHVLLVGLVVAVLSAALPYSLEFEAMRRLPSSVYGVLMSLEPAIAALVGFLVLAQSVTPVKLIAIGLVVLASIGILGRSEPAPPEP